MEISEMVGRTAESLTAGRVFSAPLQQDGATIILAAAVRGGGGIGSGSEQSPGALSRTGSGFGLMAKPAGAFVVRNGKVHWRPAVDLNRIVLGAQVVAVCALLLARSVVRARGRRFGR